MNSDSVNPVGYLLVVYCQIPPGELCELINSFPFLHLHVAVLVKYVTVKKSKCIPLAGVVIVSNPSGMKAAG